MSNPTPPLFPVSGDDDRPDETVTDPDGETTLDPDLDDESIDSADADRLASGADDDGV